MAHTTLYKVGKWLILIALLTYTVLISVWAGQRDSKRRCSGVEVRIEQHSFMGDTMTQRGVITELAAYDKNLKGKLLTDIDTYAIERYLSRLSNFESVQCYVTTKGKLRISVIPVIPELRVFDGSDSYYVNKDGKRIAANARFFADMPVVSGHFTRGFPATAVLPVAQYIAADSLFKHLIMMIRADSPDDIILVPRIAGHVINIGDARDLPVKFRNIRLAYREIMPHQGWDKYDTISVKFAGRIIATRRNKAEVSHVPKYEQTEDLDEEALQSATAGQPAAPRDTTSRSKAKISHKPNT